MAGLSTAESDWLLAASTVDVHGFYAEIGVDLPRNAGEQAQIRCFANAIAHRRDDRTASCSISLLTGLWKCHGCGESGNAYGAAVAVGYPERRAAQLARQYGLFVEAAKKKPRMATWRDHNKWKNALWNQPAFICRLGELKGWTPYAIQRAGLGWDGERITFTIRNWVGGTYKIVGVARYLPGGDPKMIALPGSKRELFPAPEHMPTGRPLFVVEGEPDAVSVRSVGHQAVAVPGASSWRSEWAGRLRRFPKLVVLCDCDRQGRALAMQVASDLRKARLVDLEPDRDDGYDVGDLVMEASRSTGGLQALGRVLGRLADA